MIAGLEQKVAGVVLDFFKRVDYRLAAAWLGISEAEFRELGPGDQLMYMLYFDMYLDRQTST